MLTPEQTEGLQAAFEQLAEPLVETLVADIARRVSRAGQLTSTAAYQVWRAQQLGKSRDFVEKAVADWLKISIPEVRKLFRQAAETGYDFDIASLPREAVPFAENASVQQIVDAAVKLAEEGLQNITQTMGFAGPGGKTSPLTDAYLQSADYAFLQVSSGALDYGTAIRRACTNLAAQGIRSIDYESGRSASLEAAVRRDMMGGLGLMTEQISQKNHDELGCNGWEISAHAASAPDHEPVQGRQYSDEAYARLNASLRRRIGTLNCGHNPSPIILGVNAPQYSETELRKFREDNEKGVSYEGRHYTLYEATQKQRAIERAIRAQKRRLTVAENQPGAGQEEAAARLAALRRQYRDFSAKTGLRTEDERLFVSGFGRKGAGQTGDRHGRKWYNKGNGSSRLADTSLQRIPVTPEAIEAVPLVESSLLSPERSTQLQQAHQQLLRRVMQEPVGTEAAAFYRMNMEELSFRVGTIDTVKAENFRTPYIAMHNHPDGLTFSEMDIDRFISFRNMKILTAVGNDGSLYWLEKSNRVNLLEYVRFLNRVESKHPNRLKSPEEYLRYIYEILEGGEQYGVIYREQRRSSN